jgi:mannose-6-phosphate isomerase-like protein (cupin superfamily)
MTSSTSHLTAFTLSETLATLQPDASVQLLPFNERGRAQANWIVGIRSFSGKASVHGSHWERHPRGDEILTLLEGGLEVILHSAQADKRLTLHANESVVVPQGCWHRLEVTRPGRLLFITPSTDSEHRLCEEC